MPHSTGMDAISTQPVESGESNCRTGALRHTRRARQTNEEDVMKRMKAPLSLAGLAFLWLMFCAPMLAQQPPDNVEGNWTIYSTSIQNGETVVKHVQIEQYGNSLTGHFEGPDQSGPIQGQINGHHIRFSTVTRNVLNFWGQVSGNEMSGNYGLHGKHAPWQAVRPAAASVADPP